MQAANVGDSAAVFAPVPAKRKLAPQVQALTEDHRLTNPSERQRLAGTHHITRPVLPLGYCELSKKYVGHESGFKDQAEICLTF